MPNYRVAVDVGGTFTDVFVLDEDTADVNVAKVPSTPHDPMEAIMSGVDGGRASTCDDVTLFSHGTTVATNALITRRFPPAAMVTTERLPRRDRDPPRHQGRPLGRLQGRRAGRTSAAATGSRSTERVDYAGRVVEPLDEDEARKVAAAAARARRRDGRRLLHQRLRQPGERAAACARSSRRSCPGVVGLDVERDPARDLRARALLDDRRQRRALAARRRLRQAPRRAAEARAATPATCCCCTPAAA